MQVDKILIKFVYTCKRCFCSKGSIMRRSLATLVCILGLCLMLPACLPGEEEAKRTLADAAEATREVHADKLAMDMSQAASQLVANPAAPPVVTSELQTLRCPDGSVIAYIPRGATMNRSGAIPPRLAQQMRDNLQSRYNRNNILTPAALSGCGGDPSIAAMNTPVLRLELASAQMAITENDSPVTAVTMVPCPNDAQGRRVPGVIVNKTMSNGTTSTEEQCGDSAPNRDDLPEIELTEGQMPDWKTQLTGGDIAATENFQCIAGTEGCERINARESGTRVVCDTTPEKQQLIVNPAYDDATAAFKPMGGNISCGRGWNGELIARIKKKNCQVIRNGQAQEEPATVFDVAYVGAKCQKNGVILYDSCPVGPGISPDGRMGTAKFVAMRQPISLAPQPTANRGINNSVLAYYTTEEGAVKTNADNEILALTANPLTVSKAITPGGPATKETTELFFSRRNLNGTETPEGFDNTFTQELVELNKLQTMEAETCYSQAQSCIGGTPPEMLAVVVDRSASMGENFPNTKTPDITPHQTSCRATMANLFKAGQPRKDACTVAKEWQRAANSNNKIRNTALEQWNYEREPVYQGSELYDNIIYNGEVIDNKIELDGYEKIMENALIDAKWLPRLKNGLLLGQDCYPKQVLDDTYGNCAPLFATHDQLVASKFDAAPLRDCQPGCPGVCITDAVERKKGGTIFRPTPLQPFPDSSFVPTSMPSYRMKTVDSFLKSNLLTGLPPAVKFWYSEFIDSQPDDPESPDPARRPIDLDTKDPANPNADASIANKTFWALQAAGKIEAKAKIRGKEVGGVTPLYISIDVAIKEMQKQLFDVEKDNTRPAILTILTDGDNTSGPSEFFGTNVCEPELEPEKYQCIAQRTAKCPRLLGVCTRNAECGANETLDRCTNRDTFNTCAEATCNYAAADIDIENVKNVFGFDMPGTRKKWCESKSFTGNYITVPKLDGKLAQIDSLVGFIGRNYPGTKVYFMDIGNTTLSENCLDFKKQTYPYEGGTQVLHVFRHENNAGNDMTKAFEEMLGGSGPNIEAGQKICKMKWGDNINIINDPIANMPAPILNYETRPPDLSCKIDYLPIDLPDDSPPPNYIPNPVIPAPGQPPYVTPNDCINGYKRYTYDICNSNLQE